MDRRKFGSLSAILILQRNQAFSKSYVYIVSGKKPR